MKVLHLTDTHIAERVGRRRFGYSPILRKWEWCVWLAVEKNCDYIVHTGDIFHKPLVPRVVEQEVSKLILDAYLNNGIRHILTAGNHDIGTGVQTVAGKSYLSVAVTSGVVSDPAVDVIHNNDDLVERIATTDAEIVACHHMIVNEPVMFDHFLIDDLVKVVSPSVKAVLCGDFHTGWNEPITRNGVVWSNPGSLTRIDRNSEVGCCIIDTRGTAEFHKLPDLDYKADPVIIPWSEIYDADSLEQEKRLIRVRQSLTDSIRRAQTRGVKSYEERLEELDATGFAKLDGLMVEEGISTLLELCNQLEAG